MDILSSPWFCSTPVGSDVASECGSGCEKGSFASTRESSTSPGSDTESEPSLAQEMATQLPPQSRGVSLKSFTSLDHNSGACKKCAFYFSPVGCDKGEECDFCHVSLAHCSTKRASKAKRDRYRKLLVVKAEAEASAERGMDSISGSALR